MPQQHPGLSKQDYTTPEDFIEATKHLLDIEEFCVDLAADSLNTQADFYYGEAEDSLKQDWGQWKGKGWCWLNPPFAHIAPWAEKCWGAGMEGIKVALLVPASVGSGWFSRYVADNAQVLFLNPRLSFDGVGPYPKDCMLCLFGTYAKGYATWRWKGPS